VKLDEAGRQSVLFVKEESEWEKIFEANWKAKGCANMQYILLILVLIALSGC
jgi:hypothetical protein